MNHSKVLGAMVFFTLNNRTGSYADPGAIDYFKATGVDDNMKWAAFHDSVQVDLQDIYI